MFTFLSDVREAIGKIKRYVESESAFSLTHSWKKGCDLALLST